MKAKRLLFLVMAICLASGVKAQFYDGPDEIYYYVKINGDFGSTCFVFNFDGQKACVLNANLDATEVQYLPWGEGWVKKLINRDPNYFENRIENSNYDTKYVGNNIYQRNGHWNTNDPLLGYRYGPYTWVFKFSTDRETLDFKLLLTNQGGVTFTEKATFKRVSKSHFKVGRSTTPSGTMHE